MIYAKEVVQPPGVSSYYAIVNPDGFWQLGMSLDSRSEKISLQEMMARLPQIDLVVPHMFCFPGMTSFRAFFEDILGLPMVGSPCYCTALATNKAHTKSVVSAAGVRVAKGQEVRRGDRITLETPLIVKPNSEDNSLGLTLVSREDRISEALEVGFEHDEVLLVEEYIPGRELRVGVIEHKGELWVAPTIEYLVTEKNPVRMVQDKLERRSDGTPYRQSKNSPVKLVCPADVTPELFEKVADAAKKAHIALGCRDYSLYDFRVHAQTHEPYLLEAGLFWSFGKISVISRMLEADAQNIEEVILDLWHTAAQRNPVARGSSIVRHTRRTVFPDRNSTI